MNGESKKQGLDNPVFVEGPRDSQKSNGATNCDIERNGGQNEGEQRAQWGNGLEFLMSCIAMSVGLGNIWRFPFTAKSNGGGAFLIPYLIVLTLIGRPLYYMEMVMGQFTSSGNVKMYGKLAPVLKAIGIGQVIGSSLVATYYCSLMAITLFYLAHSFTSNFPWTICSDNWADYLKNNTLECVPSGNTTLPGINNTIGSSELWFRLEVLRQTDNIDGGIGWPDWRLALCLLASWLVTFAVSVKGVQSSGKAAYFLALFPYVIMITLLIRACTLDGAVDGILYFIDTDWNRLLDAEVWYAAVTQCFFSLNVGFGSIVMYSSYNNFDHNIGRDALVITTLDTCTSLLSGVTIFGILGNLAYEMNVKPQDVVSSGGTGLAFISYPDAIAKFRHVPWLFAILFFVMLFVLGVGSLVALQGVLNTTIRDMYPHLAPWKITGTTAVGLFLVGLIYVTPGGQYMLDLVDHFGGTFIIFIFVILEVTALLWLYGLEHFCLDLTFMTKKTVGAYWRICWGVIMPVLLIVIFLYFVVTLKPLTYGSEDLEFPPYAMAIGWSILGVSVAQAVGFLIYYSYKHWDYPISKVLSKVFSAEKWGPDGEVRLALWRKHKEEYFRQKNSSGKQYSWFLEKLRLLVGK